MRFALLKMTKPEPIESPKLAELEAEWSRLLPQCLEQCAGGRWGLFANSPVVSVFVDWPEAERLRTLTRQIKEIHATFGSVHPGCERFLHYCSLRGENIRGEPRLAAEFLQELAKNATPATESPGHGEKQDHNLKTNKVE